jgi:hypothetical protein
VSKKAAGNLSTIICWLLGADGTAAFADFAPVQRAARKAGTTEASS